MRINESILISFTFGIILSSVLLSRPVYAIEPDCQKCVAFRLDDIQDAYYSSEQRAFIEMFLRNNASLTTGIIAGDFGQDSELVNLLMHYRNDSRVEFANHGWLHEDFGLMANSTVQQELLEMGNLRIREVLGNDVPITTFIAPFNSINEQTYEAVANSGLHIVSADEYGDTIFVRNMTASSKLYHLPMTAEGSIYLSNSNSWRPVSAPEILTKMHASIEKTGNAVVMLHPWDSTETIQSVIRSIQDETDYKIVTMREMAFGENEIPEGLNIAILAVSLMASFAGVRLFRSKMTF